MNLKKLRQRQKTCGHVWRPVFSWWSTHQCTKCYLTKREPYEPLPPAIKRIIQEIEK